MIGTELYLALDLNYTVSQELAVQSLESCIREIKNWTCRNSLKFNDDKTEAMIIGTKQQLAKINFDKICVGNVVINASSSQKVHKGLLK